MPGENHKFSLVAGGRGGRMTQRLARHLMGTALHSKAQSTCYSVSGAAVSLPCSCQNDMEPQVAQL